MQGVRKKRKKTIEILYRKRIEKRGWKSITRFPWLKPDSDSFRRKNTQTSSSQKSKTWVRDLVEIPSSLEKYTLEKHSIVKENLFMQLMWKLFSRIFKLQNRINESILLLSKHVLGLDSNSQLLLEGRLNGTSWCWWWYQGWWRKQERWWWAGSWKRIFQPLLLLTLHHHCYWNSSNARIIFLKRNTKFHGYKNIIAGRNSVSRWSEVEERET